MRKHSSLLQTVKARHPVCLGLSLPIRLSAGGARAAVSLRHFFPAFPFPWVCQWLAWLTLAALSAPCTLLAQPKATLYQNDFQSAPIDSLPDDFLVLDGAFAVKEEQGNKFLQLPSTPVESFGLLFGPTEPHGVVATARIFGTARGRRAPTFGLGLNGTGGYRLQVSPSWKRLELHRGDVLKASLPFTWPSGKWTWLRLQVEEAGAQWKIQGKAWTDGDAEPAEWMLTVEDDQELPAGRAGIYGSPIAETPLRYDDLRVARIGP